MNAPLKVGVAGLGTVGTEVVRILDERREALALSTGRRVQVTAVSARDRSRNRPIDISAMRWHADPVDLARDPDVDVVVELIGGSDGPARATVQTALEGGKPVVTANKALIAAHGAELVRIAEERSVALNFEAAVAGGIPAIKALREALPANRIARVSGILNGTCNYILTRMGEEGISFEECLADAQRLGYAEADPTFDVGGYDTAHKLAILTSLAFGTRIDADAIYVEGITSITPLDLRMADDLGYRIKLLGVATRTEVGIEQRVHPTMVPKASAIAQVSGVTNAVAIHGDAVGELTLVGPGAGGGATASAVIGDISDIARGIRLPPLGMPAEKLVSAPRAPMQRHEGGYYIRLAAFDRPGTAAGIATRMAEQGISLDSILQRRNRPASAAATHDATIPVVLITQATSEANVRRALNAVLTDGHVDGTPQVIRIEKE